MKRLEELTTTETILLLLKMNENVQHIRRVANPIDYERLTHYVGMNYDLHVEHLEKLGLPTDYWKNLREDWTR